MRELLGLVLVIGVGVVAAWASRADTPYMHVMHVGVVMLGAWLTGRLFDRVGLPKISGYLVFGVAAGPYVFGLIPTAEAAERLRFANDIAISLIALTAGGEIRFDWLKGRAGSILGLTLAAVAGVWVVVAGAAFLMAEMIPFIVAPGAPAALTYVVPMLLATVAVANSPAIVIAMINDYRADGPLSRTTLAVTVSKDMLIVVLFATILSLSKGFVEGAPLSGQFLLAVAAQLGGSVLLGGVMGVMMAWYVARVKAHLVLFTVGCCLLFALLGKQDLAVGGHHFHLEPLLMALSAGMLMENVWRKTSEPLFHTIESLSLPIYCLFFAVAGARLDIRVFEELWMWVVIFSLLRTASVWASVTLGAKLVKMDDAWRGYLWYGFVPQSAVSLALGQIIVSSFPRDPENPATWWATSLYSLIVGLIALHAIIGPIGFRYAMGKAGEIGQADASKKTH